MTTYGRNMKFDKETLDKRREDCKFRIETTIKDFPGEEFYSILIEREKEILYLIDGIYQRNRVIQIMREALEFYAAGEKYIDMSEIKESEFFDDEWHAIGSKARNSLASVDRELGAKK